MFCAGCGKRLEADEKFCSKCGMKNTSATPNIQATQMPVPPPIGSPPQYTKPKGNKGIFTAIAVVFLLGVSGAVIYNSAFVQEAKARAEIPNVINSYAEAVSDLNFDRAANYAAPNNLLPLRINDLLPVDAGFAADIARAVIPADTLDYSIRERNGGNLTFGSISVDFNSSVSTATVYAEENLTIRNIPFVGEYTFSTDCLVNLEKVNNNWRIVSITYR